MQERLSQTDIDDDTPEIPEMSSSAGRPVWESESYPTEQPSCRRKANGEDSSAARDISIGEGKRLPGSVANGSGVAMAVQSYRTVSASSLTGVMQDLAGEGYGDYDHYATRASPAGNRTRIGDVSRIGDVWDDEENEGDVRTDRARWNVASSPPGDDVRSSGLRATQRIQRMGVEVMEETSNLLGQELLD